MKLTNVPCANGAGPGDGEVEPGRDDLRGVDGERRRVLTVASKEC